MLWSGCNGCYGRDVRGVMVGKSGTSSMSVRVFSDVNGMVDDSNIRDRKDLADHRCHRSQITDHRSQITDHRSQIADHRSQFTDLRSQMSGLQGMSGLSGMSRMSGVS